MLCKKDLKHIYVATEKRGYSVRIVKEKETVTYYSDYNEVVVHSETAPPKFIRLAEEGQEGYAFMTKLIDILNDDNNEIDADPSILDCEDEVFSTLEMKRSELLD